MAVSRAAGLSQLPTAFSVTYSTEVRASAPTSYVYGDFTNINPTYRYMPRTCTLPLTPATDPRPVNAAVRVVTRPQTGEHKSHIGPLGGSLCYIGGQPTGDSPGRVGAGGRGPAVVIGGGGGRRDWGEFARTKRC